MWSLELPAVLGGIGKESGISMERALNQVLMLLEQCEFEEELEDAVNASIDDVKMMISRIKR